ncbi:unnamed protein product [Prorocentrum cordatum]|uniref:Uncharacterized protein n=1 Tax=Prorocentrum cordatum TaxID=2364126 RepID=A0ABN9T5A9_9DINO|nr:unnamed protein product [Polarella glacialis]
MRHRPQQRSGALHEAAPLSEAPHAGHPWVSGLPSWIGRVAASTRHRPGTGLASPDIRHLDDKRHDWTFRSGAEIVGEVACECRHGEKRRSRPTNTSGSATGRSKRNGGRRGEEEEEEEEDGEQAKPFRYSPAAASGSDVCAKGSGVRFAPLPLLAARSGGRG